MKVLIVDDEQLAREELRCLLDQESDLDIVGESANAIEAIAAVNRLSPDVVFLDIQMPRVNGLEMLSMLDPERMPRIVFLTAHDEYAVQAFEENAFDYLLKPIDAGRLHKTLQRLRRDRSSQDLEPLANTNPLRQIPCSGQNRIYLIKLEEVEFISSTPSGIFVIGQDGQERFTELTLRTLEERTPLMRCHRQYLINPDRIKEIRFSDNNLAEIQTISGQIVPVSRRFLGPLKERLGIA
ncbi:MAG TPA: two-component system response regulator BtsR [Candidatus Sulfotelmatobacter sp.]|jgi:two-component system LytT family response regulator|nr:two-component system response regulator BtsR [Candidatus Sulfotelmatobacter sp.]